MYNNKLDSLSAKNIQWLPSLLLLPLLGSLVSCGTGSESGADPGIEEFPIAYVKRSILVDDEGDLVQPDIRRPLRSTPGGDLYIKNRANLSAPEINITGSITNGMGDVKDLEVSSDGKLLVFSLLTEDPDPNNDDDDPKWDIYIYNRDTNIVSRVIPKLSEQDITARLGDDITPYFLPNNNRIVFSSNRQKQTRAVLNAEQAPSGQTTKPPFSSQDEDNREKALVLHTMNIDGSDIKQISFNQSHDLDPSVLSNGRVLFSRWDNMNRNDAISLYTVLQDGSDLQPYYGTHDDSHEVAGALDADDNTPVVQFIQPRELLDGSIMMLQRPFSNSFSGGEIVTVDVKNFIDLNQPTASNQGAMTGISATQKVTASNMTFDGSIDIEGRYSSFFPLNDGTSRILVSKGLCQIEIDTNLDPNADPILEPFLCISDEAQALLNNPDTTETETYPAYGIWLYNAGEQTEKPIVKAENGMFLADAVVMRPYNRALINLGGDLNSDLIAENVGLLKIRSVYDFGNSVFNGCFFTECTDANVNSVLELGDPALATADQRPARFIRMVKAVGIPNRRDPDLVTPPDISARAFGRGGRRLGMKEIIGYSTIQPDGSVQVKVPANVAFYFDILDKDARRIGPRHENWLQVAAGETLSCTGCHTHPGGDGAPQPLPHARKDAEAASINSTAPAGGQYTNTLNPATGTPYLAGETMADALSIAQGVAGATPSVNVEYTDVWTDTNSLPPTASFTFAYTGIAADGLSTLDTPSPYAATSACESQWDARCRTVINYQAHIQPIWEVTPRIDTVSGADVTCISCHSTVTPVLMTTRIPQAQLNLTDFDPADADEEVQHTESYRELFFNDNFQVLVGTTLVDRTIQVPALDDNGDPILDGNDNPTFNTVPDPDLRLTPTMSANGARFSFFMEKMTGTELDAGRSLTPSPPNFVDHSNMLTPAELRLISEYLDIGGQYFNNPFDADAPPRQ